MNSNNQNISLNAELETTSNEYWVEQYEALQRLKENPDFQKVILEGYFKDKAIASTSMLATEYVRQTGTRGVVVEELIAISHLENRFHTIENLGAPVEEEELEEA